MTLKKIFLLLACITSSACSTQLYAGAARPEKDVSILSLLRSEPNMTFGGVIIDGSSVSSTQYGFSTDFHLLPGSHSLSFNYRIDGDAYCDVREHLCPAIVVEGHCSGSFVSEGGKSYVAELVNRKQNVGAVVRESLSIESLTGSVQSPVSDLQCSEKGRHASADAGPGALALRVGES